MNPNYPSISQPQNYDGEKPSDIIISNAAGKVKELKRKEREAEKTRYTDIHGEEKLRDIRRQLRIAEKTLKQLMNTAQPRLF
jgi:hypothetical protein